MSSFASISKVRRITDFNRNVCFLLLEMLSSDEFRVSCPQANTLDFIKFFYSIHSPRFESATKLVDLDGVEEEKSSEG